MKLRNAQLREAKGVSQEDLAERADIRAATLSVIENNKGNPRFSTLAAIARALEVPITDLFEDDGTDPSVTEMVAILSQLPRQDRERAEDLIRRLAETRAVGA